MVVTRHVARGSCASASAAGPAKSFVTDGSALLAQGNAVLSDTFVQPASLPTGYALTKEVSSSFFHGYDKPKDFKDRIDNRVFRYICWSFQCFFANFYWRDGSEHEELCHARWSKADNRRVRGNSVQ